MNDILKKLINDVARPIRKALAGKLAHTRSAPAEVIEILANDEIDVSAAILQHSELLTDRALIDIISKRTREHRLAIAMRKHISNGVSDAHASAFKLVMYIERFGFGFDNFWRRVTDLYEVDRVEKGRPQGRSLFRWREADDSFEQLAEPRQWGNDRHGLRRRAEVISHLAANGQTSGVEVAAAVAEYRSNRG